MRMAPAKQTKRPKWSKQRLRREGEPLPPSDERMLHVMLLARPRSGLEGEAPPLPPLPP